VGLGAIKRPSTVALKASHSFFAGQQAALGSTQRHWSAPLLLWATAAVAHHATKYINAWSPRIANPRLIRRV
jgi:hypothetical protein